MGWNAAVGAAVGGAVALQLYALYKRHRLQDGLSAEPYLKQIMPVQAPHFVVAPLVPQMRHALLDLAFGGLRSLNALDPVALRCEPFPVLGPKFGVVHFLYASFQAPVNALVWRAWATRAPRLPPLAGRICIAGGLFMAAVLPGSSYVLAVPLGVAMWYAKPAATGAPCWSSSGWWLGATHKLLAVLHVAMIPMIPTMRAAVGASLRGGVLCTSELLGMGAGLSGVGSLGAVWGTAHFALAGCNWWVLGAMLQDWALRSVRLRPSTAALTGGAGLGLAALMPSSGYLGALPLAAMQLLGAPRDELAVD